MERSAHFFKNNLALFIIAAIVTFTCITMLQFIPTPWFFIALVAMHGGIALFIFSKRRFKKSGFTVSHFYKAQYSMLVPYLAIMLYAFVTKAGILPAFDDVKMTVTLAYTAFCIVMTTRNCIRMKKELERQYTLIVETDAKPQKVTASLQESLF